MKKLFLLTALIVGITGVMFAGCKEKVASDKAGLKKIVVSEFRSEFWLPVYIAYQLGYFKEEGLDVEFVKYKDGPIAFQGMHAGDSQFCMLSSEPVLRAYDQGKVSKIILSTLKTKPYMFVTNKNIKSIKDLKGKVIFAGMPGSAPFSFVQALLVNAGLDPDRDVTWANMEYGASLGALEQGTVDGIYLRSTSKKEAQKMGATILVDMTDPAQHKKLYGSDRYESEIVTVTKDYAESNPEVIQKFVNAVIRAIIWQSKNNDESVAKMAAPLFEGVTIDAELISYLRPSMSEDGDMSVKGYNVMSEFCLKNKIISGMIPYEDIIDTSYVRRAFKKFND